MTVYTQRDALLTACEPVILSDLQLLASVEFGVMQSNGNCVNIGICRINTTHCNQMVLDRPKHRRCPLAEALLRVSDNGRLLVFFPRAGMMACTERTFFRGPVFPVPAPYCLPESVLEGLPGLDQNIIAAGLYPIRRNNEGYWIEF